MKLDTNQCAEISRWLSSVPPFLSGLDPRLYARAKGILDGIQELKAFFDRLEQMGQATEQSVMNSLPYSASTGTPGLSAGWSANGNVMGLMAGSSASLRGNLHYALSGASAVYQAEHVTASASVSALQASAVGYGSLKLMKDGQFSPRIKANAKVQGSVLAVSSSASVSSLGGSASASLCAEAGAVYAGASAVFSPTEASVDLGVGAAAVRGECTIAFTVLGSTITLTGSGSLGSAEASLSFGYKNREWEIGSKLGFIAGLGFKLKVEY